MAIKHLPFYAEPPRGHLLETLPGRAVVNDAPMRNNGEAAVDPNDKRLITRSLQRNSEPMADVLSDLCVGDPL